MSRRQAGFSLLEAIVAMVILSLVAVALYGWQNTSLYAVHRAEIHAAENDRTRSALALVESINPMQAPTGNLALGGQQIHWTAVPIEPVKAGVTAVGLPGYFDVGLYRLRVEITDASGQVQHVEVRQIGFKQVRFPSEEP